MKHLDKGTWWWAWGLKGHAIGPVALPGTDETRPVRAGEYVGLTRAVITSPAEVNSCARKVLACVSS